MIDQGKHLQQNELSYNAQGWGRILVIQKGGGGGVLSYIINTYSNIFTSTAQGTFGSSFAKVGCQGTQLSTVKRLFFWLYSNTVKITSLIWRLMYVWPLTASAVTKTLTCKHYFENHHSNIVSRKNYTVLVSISQARETLLCYRGSPTSHKQREALRVNKLISPVI